MTYFIEDDDKLELSDYIWVYTNEVTHGESPDSFRLGAGHHKGPNKLLEGYVDKKNVTCHSGRQHVAYYQAISHCKHLQCEFTQRVIQDEEKQRHWP